MNQAKNVKLAICLATSFLALFFTPRASRADISDGLALYYPFDADDGGIAIDASGNGHHGVVHNAQWRSDGPVGGHLYLNGQNAFIDVGHGVNFPTWSQFSISVWFLNDGAGVNAGYGQKLIDKTSMYHDSYIRIIPDGEPEKGAIGYAAYENWN